MPTTTATADAAAAAAAVAPTPWSTPFSSVAQGELPAHFEVINGDGEEEEEEVFYETIDRVLSSGSSDDDLTTTVPPLPAATGQHRRHCSPYDLWLSPPSSVQERRGRLLHQLGLSPEPHGHSSDTDHSPDPSSRFNVKAPSTKESGDIDHAAGMQKPFPKVMGSPIAGELLRRESGDEAIPKLPRGARRKGWLKTLRHMAGAMVSGKERKAKKGNNNGEKRDKANSRGARRRNLTGDRDAAVELAFFAGLEKVRVRQGGRGSWRELTGMFVMQEVRAHVGAVWTVKFSVDGRYLATAGEDCVVHVWEAREVEWRRTKHVAAAEAVEEERPKDLLSRSGRRSGVTRKLSSSSLGYGGYSFSLENVALPEKVFALSEEPVCSFHGHGKDVLDLSWSKSKYLLSSSMDKTVKMWRMSDNSCLRTFSHNDFVTCIQFNPFDDNYFISGSLDTKVRIWSIENGEVVHWSDMHGMVTAVCYTPGGQGAFVGSNKGSCHLYDMSDNKMQLQGEVKLCRRKKRPILKKITGFQFAPGSSSEVFVTSADSRIRVVDDLKVVHKFKGFRNKTSQISASLTADGEHVVCASEDSQIYVWRYDPIPEPTRTLGDATASQSYESFHYKHVTVAAAWPRKPSSQQHSDGLRSPPSAAGVDVDATLSSSSSISDANDPHHPHSERASATWPEENLSFLSTNNGHCATPTELEQRSSSAWGMAIVAAGRGGEIKVFQNFGYPFHA